MLSLTALIFFAFFTPAWAQCANPVKPEGALYYNTDFNIMQYCDGTNWIAMGSLKASNLDFGLVGHWKLDEAGGALIDSSGNANDGTPNGGPAYGPNAGIIKGALTFDGVDDYVLANDSASLEPSSLTITAWIRTSDTDGALVAKYESLAPFFGYGFGLGGQNSGSADDGKLAFWSSAHGAWVVGISRLDDNIWHHVAVTFNAATNNAIFYIDGLIDNTATSASPPASNAGLGIGWFAGGVGEDKFSGTVDDVRVYDRTLSSSEIQALYNMGLSDGLVAGWRLDETSGTTAVNFVSAGLNGTMQGGLDAANDSVPGQVDTALQFDGVDDYVSVSDPGTNSDLDFGIGDTITIVAWVRPDTLTNYAMVATKGGTAGTASPNYQFELTDGAGLTQRLSFYFTSSVNTWHGVRSNTDVLSTGQWQHVAVVFPFGSSSNAEFYHNGVRYGTETSSGNPDSAPLQTNENLWIGAEGHGGFCGAVCTQLNGAIDDVRIYDRALTPAEIQTLMAVEADCASPIGMEGEILYNQGSYQMQYCNGTVWVAMGAEFTGTPPNIGPQGNLIAHWPMDTDMGGFTPDLIGTNDATLAGAAVVLPAGGFLGGAADIPWGDKLATTDGTAVPSKGPFSLSMWVNMRSHPWTTLYASKTLGSPTDNWSLTTNDSGDNRGHLLFWAVYSGTDLVVQTIDNLYSNGQWVHFAATWDGTDSAAGVHLYVNGIEAPYAQQTDPTGTHTAVTGRTMDLGGHPGSSVGRFDGKMDDVRLFNRVLTPAEVLELYESKGICTNPSGLEGDMFYNGDFAVMQYCNGTDWVGVGKKVP